MRPLTRYRRKMSAMSAYVTLLLLLSLVGCSSSETLKGPGIERETLNIISQDDRVTIGITHAVLGDQTTKNLSFWWHSFKVVSSLDSNPGFIGYKVKTSVLRGEAWTMTVWEQEQDLDNFVHSPSHRAAMSEGYAALSRAEFVRATIPKKDVPKSWEDVEAFVALLREQEDTATQSYKEMRFSDE